jgi:hypothetical protein
MAEASEADSKGGEEGCVASAGDGVLGNQCRVRTRNDSEQRSYTEESDETGIHENPLWSVFLYPMCELKWCRKFKGRFKAECRMLSADGWFCLFMPNVRTCVLILALSKLKVHWLIEP